MLSVNSCSPETTRQHQVQWNRHQWAVPGNPTSLLLVSALTGSTTSQGFHTEGYTLPCEVEGTLKSCPNCSTHQHNTQTLCSQMSTRVLTLPAGLIPARL